MDDVSNQYCQKLILNKEIDDYSKKMLRLVQMQVYEAITVFLGY